MKINTKHSRRHTALVVLTTLLLIVPTGRALAIQDEGENSVRDLADCVQTSNGGNPTAPWETRDDLDCESTASPIHLNANKQYRDKKKPDMRSPSRSVKSKITKQLYPKANPVCYGVVLTSSNPSWGFISSSEIAGKNPTACPGLSDTSYVIMKSQGRWLFTDVYGSTFSCSRFQPGDRLSELGASSSDLRDFRSVGCDPGF